jgi:hypothetical protein
MHPKARAAILFSALVLSLAAVWFQRQFASNRVTLDFSESDLAMVVASLERQTWETIWVGKGAARKVSVKASGIPMDKALDLVAIQTEGEWAEVFVIHSDGDSLGRLRRRIESGAPSNVWTNYPAHGFRAIRSPFDPSAPLSEPLNYAATNKEAAQVAKDLSRFSKSLIVVEDGVTGRVSLIIQNATIDEAAKLLARKLGRKCTRLWVIRPFFDVHRRPSLPPPGLQSKALPEEVRRALESGKPVQMRFEPAKHGGGEPQLPPQGNLAGPAEIPLLPPFDPAEERMRIQAKTLDEIRNSTPDQRLERLRQVQMAPRP